MKQKIRKSKKVKNKLTSDHSEVLLEEMNSNLKLVLEGHAGLDKKIDDLHGEMNFRFNKVDQRFEQVDQRFDGIDSNFKTVFEYLSKIDDELQSIKSEITELKISLREKSDKNKLSALEERVEKLEENFLHYYNLAKATQ